MKCVKCNQEIAPNSPFCGSCGAKVENVSRFCPGCGTSVANDLQFCGTCGANLSDEVQQTQVVPTTQVVQSKFCGGCGQSVPFDSKFCGTCGFVFTDVVQQPAQPSAASIKFKETLTKIKDFIVKHKVPFIIVTSLILVAIIGWTCFQKFYDFTKLSWVESYGDYNVEYTAGTEIKLKAEAYDKEDALITDIEYKVSAGEIEVDGLKVVWYLPEEEGTYTITAKAPSGKEIEKEVKKFKLSNQEDAELFMEIEEEELPEGDEDGDGLTNAEEETLGTDKYKPDTDSDGLIDKYEVEVKTDPLKLDTDGDGLKDGSEIALDMDPLKADSKGDGIKDGEREFTTNIKSNGVQMTITGTGDVVSTTIDVYDNNTLGNTEGIVGKVYNFETDSKIKEAKLVITYNEKDVVEAGLTEENLTFYNFDINTKELTPVETIVDTENNTITVTLKHFSKYVLADKNMVNLLSETNILFVLDDSVSMYSEKQMIELGFDSSTGAIGSDTEFKRITLSEKLLNMLSGEYKYAVAEFSGTYYLYNDFIENKDDVKASLNKIRNMDHNDDGTDIVNALKKGIKEFDSDENNNYIILLTDGKDTTGDLYYEKKNIITAANEKDVSICIIGLGNVDKKDLSEIATSTGCGFYYATDDSVLEDVYRQLSAEINYGQIDIDGDGKADGTVVYDSGFIPSRDGLPFANYSNVNSPNGSCYGIATVANYFYRGVLPSDKGSLTEKNLLGKELGKSNGYYFGYSSYFRDFENTLYNYELEEMYQIIFNPKNVLDLWDKVEDGTLKINDKYAKKLKKLGAVTYTQNYNGALKDDFNKIELFKIDVDSELVEDEKDDDVELLRAINRWHVDQHNNEYYDFDLNSDKTYAYITKELVKGNPVVLTYDILKKNKKTGAHAVNLIRIIVDNEDSDKFYFEIYDSNRPGVSKYLEATRTKYNKYTLDYTAWTNEYAYDFSYIGEDYDVKEVAIEVLDY